MCWRPHPSPHHGEAGGKGGKGEEKESTWVLHRFDYRECEIWYMRFSLDYQQQVSRKCGCYGKQ